MATTVIMSRPETRSKGMTFVSRFKPKGSNCKTTQTILSCNWILSNYQTLVQSKCSTSKFICETPENSNFLKNGKIVISVKIRNFSRSRMTKQTSPLESSHEIYLTRRILLNSETVRICIFFEALGVRCRKTGWRDM